jgi:uncharacterized protein
MQYFIAYWKYRTNMQTILADNLSAITSLCLNYHVNKLFAFVSVCTNHFTKESDIDLPVSFQAMDYGDYAGNYFELADKFEVLFHRRVDLVTEKSVSNPYFIKSIEKTNVMLYG